MITTILILQAATLIVSVATMIYNRKTEKLRRE
jgi:hypothetical protein